MTKIALKPHRHAYKSDHTSSWMESPPFSVNPRGILIHRVRHVTAYYDWSGEKTVSHYGISHLCGNGFCIDPVRIWDVLTDDPPKERLLCNFCEMKAMAAELPNGDKLAGRHIHRGVLVAKRVCCQCS